MFPRRKRSTRCLLGNVARPVSSFKIAGGSLNSSLATPLLHPSSLHPSSPSRLSLDRDEPRAIVKTFSRLLHVRYVNASPGRSSTSKDQLRPFSLALSGPSSSLLLATPSLGSAGADWTARRIIREPARLRSRLRRFHLYINDPRFVLGLIKTQICWIVTIFASNDTIISLTLSNR